MRLDLDLEGHHVLVLGGHDDARQALSRYRREGALVSHFPVPGDFLGAELTVRVGLVAVVGALAQHPEDASGDWRGIVEHYRAAGVPVVRERAAGKRGAVTLVGGGCGSAGLLTQDAVDALRDADTVLYDRLGPWQALRELCTAELVDVGKLPGHHKVPQEDINTLLVQYAQAGQNVVRLKGGDPYVFGRGSEELAACTAAGIPVQVIPGISSAIAVPSAAGIPVTLRGVSHSFTVVSGHAPLTDAEHLHLAGLGGTIVVLMGMATLPHLAAGLRRSGLSPSTPLAVIERGHRPDQRVTLTELGRAERDTGGCGNPAVIVIGDVVRQCGTADTGFKTLVTALESV